MSQLQSPAELPYRPDIDGLRAIAVGTVVLFHAKLGLVPGGYTGVDVFFVISGFLISSIIWRELQAGTFTFAGFYERRIRRIFPVLALILLVTLVLGALVLAPQDYFLMGRSARATAAFYSNFYFNSQFGYFMPMAETQALLHTWSLAVEEQFYLVAPFFLILLARLQIRYRVVVFLALFAASLAISSIGAFDENKAAFYLPQSRAFELMIGMALVIGLGPVWANNLARELAAFAGLGMIAAAAFLYSEETPFPGLAAAMPCLGTALLISTASNGSTLISRALSVPAMVAVGRISYSLYLWHWPLFVFAEYEYGERLPITYRVGLIGVAVALSFLTFRFVEQPARRRTPVVSRWIVIGTGLSAMAVLVALSQGVIQTKGWPGRLEPNVAAFSRLVTTSTVGVPCKDPEDKLTSLPGCAIGAKDVAIPTALLWGDSHAMVLVPRLSTIAAAKDVRVEVVVAGACPPFLPEATTAAGLKVPARCEAVSRRVAAMLHRKEIRHVMVTARWAFYAEGSSFDRGVTQPNRFDTGDLQQNRRLFVDSFRATIVAITAMGHTVSVIGPVPELNRDVPNAMMKALMRGEDPKITAPVSAFAERQAAVLGALDAVSHLPGVRIAYPHKVLCGVRDCETSSDGKPLYTDANHLGLFGTDLIAPLLADAMAVASQNEARAN